MKKLLVAIGLVLVLVTSAIGADLPCGFQRLADTCMAYEPDENGLRGTTYTWIENGEEFVVAIGYKEGSYVGFIVGGKDTIKYPPIAIIYGIPSSSFARVFLLTGEVEPTSKEFACGVMETFWSVFDTRIMPKGTDA